MSHKPISEVRLQNLLAEHADDLVQGRVDLEALLQRHQIDYEQEDVQHLLQLARQIFEAMPDVSPSEAFVTALYARLMGAETLNVLMRLRQLPRHMQFAAGIGGLTLTAGFFWIAARARREALEYLASWRETSGTIISA